MSNLPLSEALRARMEQLGIDESKLIETFVRSGGKGGQNVNKVATCVQLYDLQHNVRVSCQEARHQFQNRVRARELLCEKIEVLAAQQEATSAADRHKKRVKSKRPSKAQKQRNLEDKRKQSAKKRARSKVQDE